MATDKGHLHKERHGLQSTKPSSPMKISLDDTPSTYLDKDEYIARIKKNIAGLQDKPVTTDSITTLLTGDILQDFFPPSPAPNTKSNDVVYALMPADRSTLGYLDLPGRFPYRSARGNEYIVVGLYLDTNNIQAVAIKNREAPTIKAAWEIINKKFEAAGVAPTTWILDNEASQLIKDAMTDTNVNFQLIPPHVKRANIAERAIQTFKNHFKSILASINPDFPVSQWDFLLAQTLLTLNLLRTSRSNPKLSAHAYVFGNFDFQATPLAPLGTKVVAHLEPTIRSTYSSNGEEGWYVGPSLQHYRCVDIYFPKTRQVRHCNTVKYYPTVIPIPTSSLEDHLRQASSDIIHILLNPSSSSILNLQSGSTINNALLEISNILNQAEKSRLFRS